MLVGGAILAAGSAVAGDRPDLGAVAPEGWWAWAYLTVVVSVVAFSAYAYALAALPVSTVATYAYVNPVIAVLLGTVFLNEVITGWVLLAGAAIVTSVVLIVRAQSAPVADPEVEEDAATLAA